MIELMGCYQQLHGLKALGDHRPLTDKLFEGTTTKCLRCNGSGLLDAKGGKTCVHCPRCRGLRVVYIISQEEVEAIRQKVIEAYPNAGAPWKWPPGYDD
jgi:phage FluMu protein Com